MYLYAHQSQFANQTLYDTIGSEEYYDFQIISGLQKEIDNSYFMFIKLYDYVVSIFYYIY